MTDEEIDDSAKYFAQQKLRAPRLRGREPAHSARRARGWIYKEVGGTEDLGDRLLEVAHGHRAPRAPRRPARIHGLRAARFAGARQTLLAIDRRQGQDADLRHLPPRQAQGTDKIPPIAGRSPTYLLRQMLAFKNGTRSGEAAKQMDPVIEKLELEDMIALAAYVGSLYPVSAPERSAFGWRMSPPSRATARLSMSTRVPRSRLPPSS